MIELKKLENGWIKFFSDTHLETGFDKDVKAGKASWQHGRLDGLNMAGIRHNDTVVFLYAREGNWWQSDTMVSKFRGYGKAGDTEFITRRLEYQIAERDFGSFVSLVAEDNIITVKVSKELPQASNEAKETVKLSLAHIGKWLYVSLDVKSNTVAISFHDEKK